MNFISFRKKDTILWLLAVAGVCQNLSAAWFGVIFISPGFEVLQKPEWPLVLIVSFTFGMVMLYLSVYLTKQAKRI